MTIRDFWRGAGRLSRAALICAALSALLNVASYAGVTMASAGGSLAVVHLAIMALGFVLFARIWHHHSLAWRQPAVRPDRPPVPARLGWAAAASLVYLLVLFTWLFAAYGEGAPEVRDGREVWVAAGVVVRKIAPGTIARFEAHTLRLFSAAWLFFGLLIALSAHTVDARLRAYEAPGGHVAA